MDGPHARSWLALSCGTCGKPWPCQAFRGLQPLVTPAQRAAAVVRMTIEVRQAREELIRVSPPALVVRFFWWLRLSRRDAQVLAGEVWPSDQTPKP